MNPFKEPLNRMGFLIWCGLAYMPILIVWLLIRIDMTPESKVVRYAIAITGLLLIFVFIKRLIGIGLKPIIAIPLAILMLYIQIPVSTYYLFFGSIVLLLLLPTKITKS
jgi:hypothetical protein